MRANKGLMQRLILPESRDCTFWGTFRRWRGRRRTGWWSPGSRPAKGAAGSAQWPEINQHPSMLPKWTKAYA